VAAQNLADAVRSRNNEDAPLLGLML